jgi:hypothetical protein
VDGCYTAENDGNGRATNRIDYLFASPFAETFTVGHALTDYVEWTRLVAASSHFLTIINGERFRHFIRELL